MALTGRVTTIVYGTIQGAPPFIGENPGARIVVFDTPQTMSVAATGANIFPASQGVRFGDNYVYSFISQPPTGLNVHGVTYGSADSVATLVTNGS